MSIVYKDESYTIMGAYFEVYKEKGCGFVDAGSVEMLSLPPLKGKAVTPFLSLFSCLSRVSWL